MDYLTFKKLVTKYVEDNYDGGLSVLKTYNKSVQDKVHSYIINLMLKDCSHDFKEQQKVMKQCQAYENRFYEECMK